MKKTKRSLFTSLVTLLLCSAMFVGSTFAWFTDTASSTGNRIQAGTLDIDLLMYKKDTGAETYSYQSIDGGQGDIFKEAANANNSLETLWEPGKTQVVYLAVQNKGNLALKYQFYLDVNDHGLCNDGDENSSLEYILVPNLESSDEDLPLDNYAALKSYLAGVLPAVNFGDVKPGRTVVSNDGILDEISEHGKENEKEYFALIVHMKEDAGNVYQGKDCIIDVYLTATQYTSEEDGFGSDQYDAQAQYKEKVSEPQIDVVEKKVEDGKDTTFISSVTPSEETGKQTKVTIPKEVASFVANSTSTMTVEATPTLLANNAFTISSNGAVGAIDLEVKVNGELVEQFKDSNDQPVDVKVETYVAKNMTNVTLSYNNDEIWNQVVNEEDVDEIGELYYDKTTGRLVYLTNHFSEFVLGANEVAYIDGTNTAYKTVSDAFSAATNTDTVFLIKNASNENDIYVYNGKTRTLDLNGYTLSFNDDHGFDVGYSNTAATLNIIGEGTLTQPSSGRYGLFYVRGCETDNGKKQIINIGKDVITKNPSKYAAHLCGKYGIELNYKGIDQSKFGIFSLNGEIQERTGNITKVIIDGAQFDGFYLAGFANLTVKNCNISAEGNVMSIKSGNVDISNCTFNIDYPDYHTTFAYRNVHSGASTAVPGTLSFESGCEGYAGIGTVNIDNTNHFIYNGTRQGEWADVILFDNGDTGAIFNVDVNKYDVISSESFEAKIMNVSYMNGENSTTQELYFTSVDAMTGYTVYKFKEELGLSCDVTFGQRYVKESGEWIVYNPQS